MLKNHPAAVLQRTMCAAANHPAAVLQRTMCAAANHPAAVLQRTMCCSPTKTEYRDLSIILEHFSGNAVFTLSKIKMRYSEMIPYSPGCTVPVVFTVPAAWSYECKIYGKLYLMRVLSN
jgi:hypothetical protein